MQGIDKKRFFYINSANRVSGSTASFAVPIQLPQNEDYNRISVTQVSIPVSYYLVDSGSNTFTLKEGTSSVVITLTPGNYNVNSFSVAVKALLNAASPHGWVYAINYPTAFIEVNTGKITYSVSGNSSQPIFSFPAQSTLHQQFGFIDGSTNQFVNNVLVSTIVVNFVNENILILHSDLVDNGSDDVLQEVYASNNPTLSVAIFTSGDIAGFSKKLRAPKNQIMNVYLTNEANQPINLNGQDIQISLLCYKDNDFYDLSKKYMKYIIEHNENQQPQ